MAQKLGERVAKMEVSVSGIENNVSDIKNSIDKMGESLQRLTSRMDKAQGFCTWIVACLMASAGAVGSVIFGGWGKNG